MSVTSLLAELRSENAELLRRLIIQQERIKRLEELTAAAPNAPIGPVAPAVGPIRPDPELMTQWTYNGITYWRNQRNELWHQTFERDIGSWAGVYDPMRNTIIMGQPEPTGVRGPIAPSVRRSARLLAKRKQCTQTIQHMVDECRGKTPEKKAEIFVKMLNYMNANIGNVELMFAASKLFKNTIMSKCREFQKEKNFPAVVHAATEFLERYT